VVDARKPDVGGDVSEADAGEDVGVLVVGSLLVHRQSSREQESGSSLDFSFSVVYE
jgi:hypothetical protein